MTPTEVHRTLCFNLVIGQFEGVTTAADRDPPLKLLKRITLSDSYDRNRWGHCSAPIHRLDGRWDHDLWVFGYGSLMWDPAMEFAEVLRGRTEVYSRSFCLWDVGGRGSLERPGLMLAIDAGIGCEGLVFRIEAEKLDHETFVLFRLEMIASAYRPIWLTLETVLGPIEALSFAANRDHERIVPDIPVPDQARMIAHAEGLLGGNFDYLADTHAHLTLLGVEDAYITDLHLRAAGLRAAS